MDAAVHLVLRDADPNGLVIATRDNWTGKAISLPLADLKLLTGLITGAGVYILDGIVDDGSNSQVIYIGEAEDVHKRLTTKNHLQLINKNIIWQRVVIFSTVGEDLHKAHVKWLESKLIEKAKKSGKYEVTNDKAPIAPMLPQIDLVFIETFLQNMLVLYPLLGINIFSKADLDSTDSHVNDILKEELFITKNKERIASGRITNTGGIVILAKSRIYKFEPDYIAEHTHIVKARKFLKDNNLLDEITDKNYYILKENYELTSPSTAASVVTGRSENGRVKWANKDGKKFEEIYQKSI